MKLRYFFIAIIFFSSTACSEFTKKKSKDNTFGDINKEADVNGVVDDKPGPAADDDTNNGNGKNKDEQNGNKKGTGGGTNPSKDKNPNPDNLNDGEIKVQEYMGFGQRKLGLDRVEADTSKPNRMRIKPFAVLADEYQRVTGIVPESLAASRDRFAPPPNRWFSESERSSLTVIASFNISYEAALKLIEAQPDLIADKPAAEVCGSFAQKAWSRIPSDDEVTTCVEIASKDAELSAIQKWAYALATILSASGFVAF